MRRSLLLTGALGLLAAGAGGRTARAEGPSSPERIAWALSATGSMLVDSGTVTLVNWGHASSLPATGGHHSPRDLEVTPRWGDVVTTDWRIAADDSFVYATTEAGMLFRVPRAGARATPIATYGRGYPGRVAHLALDAGFVYLTHFITHQVMRVPKAGGRLETLYTDPERRFPGEIAVDARSVYWVNQLDGSLMRMPKAGGAPRQLARGVGRSFGLALDGARAFFTDYDGGRVLAVPLAGGDAVTIAAGQGTPSGIALDGDRVYFTDAERGTVVAARKDGAGAPVVVASGQPVPVGIAVAGDYLYWVDVAMGDQDGSVMRMRKPTF